MAAAGMHRGEFHQGNAIIRSSWASAPCLAPTRVPLRCRFTTHALLPGLDRSSNSLYVTLNTRVLLNQRDLDRAAGGALPTQTLTNERQQQEQGKWSDEILSKATVKARKKVLNVVLHNLRLQRATSAATRTKTDSAASPQPAAPQSTGSDVSLSRLNPQHEPLAAPAHDGSPSTAESEPASSSSIKGSGQDSNSDIIMELVLEGNSVADFAGALTLLLECGQHEEQVIAAGSAFLKGRGAAAEVRRAQQAGLQDVVLCVARAHSQLALQSIGSDLPPSGASTGLGMPAADSAVAGAGVPMVAAAGVGHATPAGATSLETAYRHASDGLRLLRERHSISPSMAAVSVALRKQLQDLLLRVTPPYVWQLLDSFSPQPAAKPQRDRAMEVLKQALWQMEGPEQRVELLGQVRQLLTASEQISLFDAAPVPEAQLSEQELYDAALAYIWEGYTKRWPHHVYRADMLLDLISQRKDLGLDVTLERNVCALLLGKESEAQGQLVAAQATLSVSGTEGTDGEEQDAGDS